MRAEIGFYRANLHRGRDAASLAELRADCAAVVRDELRLDAPLGDVREALLAAIEFTPFDDVLPALARLRAAGVRLAVVSNWDVSLHEMLERNGPAPARGRGRVVRGGRRGQARPRAVPRRARPAGGDAPSTRCTSATRRRRTWPARSPPA